MGHIRLGRLPQSKRWRAVVDLLEGDWDLLEIAGAAAEASAADLKRLNDDPVFQYVAQVLVELPLQARGPGYATYLENLGVDAGDVRSVPGLLAGLDRSIQFKAFEHSNSDAAGLARAAFLETLSVALNTRLPSLFEPTPTEVRKAIAGFSSGDSFAVLARDFFARLTYRSIDYYLSRELANHTGQGKRFANDADRVGFDRDLAQHTFEAARIVESFAGGWYGKTVWRDQSLSASAVSAFTGYTLKKLCDELARQRNDA